MSFDYNMHRQNILSVKGFNPKRTQFVDSLVCADGFTMSVQAGEHLYSTPRSNVQLYHEVEVGFPSKKEKTLMPYAEDSTRSTDTVYGYVPVEIVNAIVDAHGGLVKDDFVSTV